MSAGFIQLQWLRRSNGRFHDARLGVSFAACVASVDVAAKAIAFKIDEFVYLMKTERNEALYPRC